MTEEKKQSKDWSLEEETLLAEIRPIHTLTETHQIFCEKGFVRSRKAIERKACNLGIFFKEEKEPKTARPIEREEQSEAWQKISTLKTEYKEDYEHRKVGMVPDSEITRKILCISDLHIPFDRDDLVHSIIEEHSDADILVVNGDLLDLHAVSTWPKERAVVLRKEYDIAMEYIRMFSERFPKVVLTRGNHEYRLNRYFHSNISQSVSFMVSKEILGRLVKGEVYDTDGNIVKNYNFKNVYYEGGSEAWFIKIGKTMFLHPQAFSSVEGKTAINAQEFFMERDDIDCIVVGHTHQQAQVPSRNKLCIEQGCLCCPMDYEKQGKLKYKAMTLGYCVIYQDKDGNCSFNRSGIVYLGTQYPIKREFDDIVKALERKI